MLSLSDFIYSVLVFLFVVLLYLYEQIQSFTSRECDLARSKFTRGCMVALDIVEEPLLGKCFSYFNTTSLRLYANNLPSSSSSSDTGLPSAPLSNPFNAHYISSASQSSPFHYLDVIGAAFKCYRLAVAQHTDKYELLEDEFGSGKDG
jgi:hypothetical protein